MWHTRGCVWDKIVLEWAGAEERNRCQSAVERRDFGPYEGTTVQLCGDSNVADKWINGHYAMGKKYKEQVSEISKNAAFVVEEESRVHRKEN